MDESGLPGEPSAKTGRESLLIWLPVENSGEVGRALLGQITLYLEPPCPDRPSIGNFLQ